ncbi:glycosyltransferase [Janthinobacterium sp.]|uniref:glycosyltransferase n=1 Tax=Janthinobacterium sp. TaxID=1871054 RepID=UPI00293D9010|nr:glycosyltransferase [Janthinobacterium sp.]
MKILHILPSIDPKGGGPMTGVGNYGRQAVLAGHQVEVLTLDAPDARFLADFPLKSHAIGPSLSSYRYNKRLVPWLMAHAREYDVVVINGLWQYHSFGAWRALRKLGVPYFVFTHGMLDPWFKHTYPLKHLKKWLTWPWGDYRVLRDARAVLFTCEEERLLAPQSFWLYRANGLVVNYGAASAPTGREALRAGFLAAHPELEGKRLFVFLSRIHVKKGCDLLIEAFAEAAARDPELHLVMAGPDETGLVPALQAQAAALGMSGRVSWTGMLRGDMKWGAFCAAEAFVLPSHQENFGIAVAEALGCGLPVLISDKVNIWREIEADGAGFVAPDTVAGTRATLGRWLALDAAGRAAMAQRAGATFERRYTVQAMKDSLIATFEGAQA